MNCNQFHETFKKYYSNCEGFLLKMPPIIIRFPIYEKCLCQKKKEKTTEIKNCYIIRRENYIKKPYKKVKKQSNFEEDKHFNFQCSQSLYPIILCTSASSFVIYKNQTSTRKSQIKKTYNSQIIESFILFQNMGRIMWFYVHTYLFSTESLLFVDFLKMPIKVYPTILFEN